MTSKRQEMVGKCKIIYYLYINTSTNQSFIMNASEALKKSNTYKNIYRNPVNKPWDILDKEYGEHIQKIDKLIESSILEGKTELYYKKLGSYDEDRENYNYNKLYQHITDICKRYRNLGYNCHIKLSTHNHDDTSFTTFGEVYISWNENDKFNPFIVKKHTKSCIIS